MNNNNAFGSSSECSSGCESGWTLYLEEHSFVNHQHQNGSGRGGTHHEFMGGKESVDDDDREEDEDLSMVSDASSGPPPHNNHHNNNNNEQQQQQRSSKKRQKVIKEKNQRHFEGQQHLPSSFLDDTATSPLLFDFSMNNVTVSNQQTWTTESMLDDSQPGFSATYYFEGRSSLQDHYGFLQPQPHNLSETTQVHGNKWYGGNRKRWE